jgi:hypothetical protein
MILPVILNRRREVNCLVAAPHGKGFTEGEVHCRAAVPTKPSPCAVWADGAGSSCGRMVAGVGWNPALPLWVVGLASPVLLCWKTWNVFKLTLVAAAYVMEKFKMPAGRRSFNAMQGSDSRIQGQRSKAKARIKGKGRRRRLGSRAKVEGEGTVPCNAMLVRFKGAKVRKGQCMQVVI